MWKGKLRKKYTGGGVSRSYRLWLTVLCVLTVALLLPVQSLAANMSWTWTVTIIGGNYYRSDGTASNTNKYTINRHLDNTEDHEIGYTFEWNTSAGGSSYV